MRYRVVHRTVYAYRHPVSVCHNLFHLQPRPCAHQRALASTVTVDPEPAVATVRSDFFGNPTTFAIVQQLHRTLAVEARSDVELEALTPPDPLATSPWERAHAALRAEHDAAMLERYLFTFDSPLVHASDALRAYVAPSFPAGRPILDGAVDLASRIHAQLAYDPGATTVATTPDETLALGRGVCQDFAHLAIGCLRALGLAARYVSGYLITERTATANGDELVGADASHAWLSVWTPEAGWVDLDPTNDRMPTDRHVTVAWGRDYGDVSPIKGVILGGGEHTIDVAVAATPL